MATCTDTFTLRFFIAARPCTIIVSGAADPIGPYGDDDGWSIGFTYTEGDNADARTAFWFVTWLVPDSGATFSAATIDGEPDITGNPTEVKSAVANGVVSLPADFPANTTVGITAEIIFDNGA